jgi:DNA-binding transcriptional LysR family regulator
VSELEVLRRLRYFVAVAKDASFTRAAQRLRVSQPAVSEAIRQLERDLRVTLLMRDRPVAVTAAGGALLQDARLLLSAAARATARVRAVAAGDEGDISATRHPAQARIAARRHQVRRERHRVGYQRACQMFYTAAILHARSAKATGIVLDVVPRGELLAHCHDMATQIAGASRAAVAEAKRILTESSGRGPETANSMEQAAFSSRWDQTFQAPRPAGAVQTAFAGEPVTLTGWPAISWRYPRTRRSSG